MELIVYIILKSPNSENYIEPITKLSEIDQTTLMNMISNLLKEFEPAQSSNEMDSFIRKEKRLLEKLDELESENFNLQAKLSEMSEAQKNFDKKIGEMNEVIQTKQIEIKELMKEREKLHTQVR